MQHKSVAGMVLDRIATSPNRPAIRVKDGSRWADVRWSQVGTRMERIAAGLLTCKVEIPRRAAITILGNTSADWIICDFAALSIGLRTVPVYATLLPEEVGYLHVDTDSVLAIVEDAAQLEKVRAIREGFEFFDTKYDPDRVKVAHIVVMDPTGIEPADDWESLADLEARGAEKLEETAEERAERLEPLDRDDVCTYTYTSGTTGPPKGVIQTNGNMLSMLECAEETGLFSKGISYGGLFLFLPLAHSFGRLIELTCPFVDSPIVISSIPSLGDDLKATKPSFFPAAPRVYEKMKAKIEAAVAGAPPVRQKLFEMAMRAGKATIPYRSSGRPMPMHIALQAKVADKVVHSKLREKMGFGRAEILLSGSAPLDPSVHEFFLACGLNLVEAYGLTETCPGLTTNLPHHFKIGTVGRPMTGISIHIAEDGEILAKGPNITQGYLNREDATSDAFDEEGWFHTGDLGSMDSDGFVKITGRKKELMKTSGGKYIAPAKLEGRLKNLPMIQEAVTVADTRNYVTALISVDPEELDTWAAQTGNPADPESKAVRDEIQKHVDEVNHSLARFETVKYFRIIPPLTVENGLLTASLKVKRKPVYERYAELIDEMYKSAGQSAA